MVRLVFGRRRKCPTEARPFPLFPKTLARLNGLCSNPHSFAITDQPGSVQALYEPTASRQGPQRAFSFSSTSNQSANSFAVRTQFPSITTGLLSCRSTSRRIFALDQHSMSNLVQISRRHAPSRPNSSPSCTLSPRIEIKKQRLQHLRVPDCTLSMTSH